MSINPIICFPEPIQSIYPFLHSLTASLYKDKKRGKQQLELTQLTRLNFYVIQVQIRAIIPNENT